MFKTTLVLCAVLLVVVFGVQPANADSDVNFTISGAYSAATSSSPLSSPSGTFTLSFALPSQLVNTDFIAGDDFSVDHPIRFSYSASNGGTASGLVFLTFYSLTSGAQPGGLFVDFCAGGPACVTGPEYQWEVTGPVLYSGPESSPTLVPASFDFTGGQFLEYDCPTCNNLDATGTFSGNVDVVATPEPEPGSGVSLFLGALCLFAAGIYQKRLNLLA